MAQPAAPPHDTINELLLLPTRAPPRPSDLRGALGRAPIPFLLALQPPRPPLSYYGRRERAAAAAAEAGASPFAAAGGPHNNIHRRRPRPSSSFSSQQGGYGDGDGNARPPPPLAPGYDWGGWGDEEGEQPPQQRVTTKPPPPPPGAAASGSFAMGFSPGMQGGGGPQQQQQRRQPPSQRPTSRDLRWLMQPSHAGSTNTTGGGGGGGFSLSGTFELAAQQRREQEQAAAAQNSKKKRPASSGSVGSNESQKRANNNKGGKGKGKENDGEGGGAGMAAKTPLPPSSGRPTSKGGQGQLLVVGGVEEMRQVALRGEQLEGLERACENVGRDRDELERFLERCQNAGEVTLALLFSDLSSSLSSLTQRYCTPKGICRHWNCTCDRRVRAIERADYTTVVGAVILLAENGQCRPCFLPLAPSARSKKQQKPSPTNNNINNSPTAAAALSPGCTLPLRQMASSNERWQAFAELMVLPHVRKIFFSAQVGLMPFVAWLISNDMVYPSYVANIADPRVAAWLLDASLKESDLEHKALLARVVTNPSTLPPPAPLEPGAVGGAVTKAVRSLVEALKATQAMWNALHARLQQRPQVRSLFFETEMRVLPLLTSMEVHGVGFDTPAVPALKAALLEKQRALQQEIFALAGVTGPEQFNVESPEQVAHVLYHKLKLPAPPLSEPGKSKHASTSEDVLISLQDKHPIVPLILRHRALAKTLHTYIEPLPLHATSRGALHRYRPFTTVRTASPRLHGQWNQCGVVTGRLSSNKPALQTIPKAQMVEGVEVKIRSFLRSHPASTLLVSADYSQIEMRILAAACGDVGMAALFQKQEGDIYRALMSHVKRKPVEAVTAAERDEGKTIALGVIYGLGAAAAARRLGITTQEAEALIRQFLAAHPRIQAFMAETKAYARRHGHVITLLGRPRPVPNIRSEQPAARNQAERQAVNGVIQGTAADLMKAAMIIVQRAIDDAWSQGEMAGPQTDPPPLLSRPTLVMQVHDELVFECPSDERCVLALKDILRRCMEEEVTASLPSSFDAVPLRVTMSVGRTLADMRTIPLC